MNSPYINRLKFTEETLEAVGIDDNGKGIVRTDNQTLFVAGLLEGEKGLIRLGFNKNTAKIEQAHLIKRLTSSPYRVEPRCPYYKDCGGCSLMHLAYPQQLIYKQNKVRNLLHKFAKLDIDVQPTLGMAEPYRFRNKVQVPVGTDSKGKTICGFYKENTHIIVPSADCLIETEEASRILKGIIGLMDKYHIQAYQEDKRSGLIRHILIKQSLHFSQVMVVLVTAYKDMFAKANFAKEINKMFPEVTTVVQNVNSRHTNVILGEEEHILFGSGKIKDSIFGLSFLISSKSFYQTNPIQLEVLYKTALDKAELNKDVNVLDAYSGTGTIGLCASEKARQVTCVEIEPSSVKDAKENARINKIDNVTFIQDDCTSYMEKNQDRLHYDVVFMDPPRKGSTPEFLNALLKIQPRRIIYISCNPVTLARDLFTLKDAYSITSVTPVDMFPQTHHVETVVALSLKK